MFWVVAISHWHTCLFFSLNCKISVIAYIYLRFLSAERGSDLRKNLRLPEKYFSGTKNAAGSPAEAGAGGLIAIGVKRALIFVRDKSMLSDPAGCIVSIAQQKDYSDG
jgi:hypothetical protein